MTYFAWFMLAFLVMAGPAMSTARAQGQQQPAPFPFLLPDLLKGTPEEEAACAPDSAKFCKTYEPDPLRVLNCLQRNRTKISQTCQQVLRNRGV